ncbi:hypothetical protein MHBO_002611 [Bonamia ostreae]|uniref:Cytochrome c oxidase assembly protein COX15 n=1 Tax=Bonamia ostreae TaxID=126728 RepID=A0ABV2AMX9_9EUKA
MSLTRFREVFKTRLNLSNFSHLRLLHKRPFNVQSSQISFNIPNGQNKVYKWLFVCSGVVFTMVVVGGVTRLTRSGLSMTSWKFLGQKFPFNQKMWEEEFARYKTFPEYKKLTSEMDLNGFKKIYVMEYLHRMLGRLLGLVFAVPAVYFAARGFINRSIAKKLSLLFLLGGSQGLIGWWMVKSGLDEKPSTHLDLPRVSPYRLSVHLVSAFVIYLALVKTGLNSLDLHLLSQNRFKTFLSKLPPIFLRRSVLVTSLIVFMTAFSGAFVAGNEVRKL